MLKLRDILPAPLHRAGLRLAHRLRVVWWRWRRPALAGVRVIAVDSAGAVLLVRHSYGSNAWKPPGGGLWRGEDPVAAGIRELAEETGCALHEARLVSATSDTIHGSGNNVHVVVGRTAGVAVPDGREVVAARFFALDALPADMSGQMTAAIRQWVAAGLA